MTIALHILSPEGTRLRADVSLVTLPGVEGPFTVLRDHAPLITALLPGDIRYVEQGKEKRISVAGGFVEVRNNQVKVCVEG